MLPEQLQAELELSGWVRSRHCGDFTEISVSIGAIGILELRMIECVERVSTKLHVHRLTQGNHFSSAYVPIIDSRTGHDIGAGISEVIGRGRGITGGIEPVVAVAANILVFQAGPAVASLVGAKLRHRVHGCAAGSQHGEGISLREGGNRIERPAAYDAVQSGRNPV